MLKSADIIETDSYQQVSFSTVEICTDDRVINCHLAIEVGTDIYKSLDGKYFSSKVPLKLKCNNFNALIKNVRVNNKRKSFLLVQKIKNSSYL